MNNLYNVTCVNRQGERDSMHIMAENAHDAISKVVEFTERYLPVKVALTYEIDHE